MRAVQKSEQRKMRTNKRWYVTVRSEVGFKLKDKEMLPCHVKAGPHPIPKEGIHDREVKAQFPITS